MHFPVTYNVVQKQKEPVTVDYQNNNLITITPDIWETQSHRDRAQDNSHRLTVRPPDRIQD